MLAGQPGRVVDGDDAHEFAVRVGHIDQVRAFLLHQPGGRARAVLGMGHGGVFLHDRGGGEHPGAVHVLDKGAHVVVGRVAEDLLGRADLLHPPLGAEDGDAVAEFERLVQVVGDEHDGPVHAGLQVDEFVLHLGADERVQGAEGLVHEQHLRIVGQGPGQAHALLHAAGKLGGLALLEPFQADQFDGVHGLFRARGLVHAADFQPELDVVEHAALRQQAEVLEDHGHLVPAQVAKGLPVELGDVFAVEQDLAGRGLDEPVQAADHGGLAAAGQAHDHEGLALFDVEAGAVDGHGAAGFGKDFALGQALLDQGQGPLRIGTEDFRQISDGYQ